MDYLRHFLGLNGPSGFGSATTAAAIATQYHERVHEKVVIVTGSNTGIGKETARVLASHGAKVILACRNLEKANLAAEAIKSESKDAQVIPMQCDLSSFASVRKFCHEFKQLQLPLNVLINNAGVMWCPLQHTKEGYELQVGTNHLGHFLLTELLLEDLKKAPGARIVILSSSAHALGYKEGIRFDDLKAQKEYSAFRAYGQSKLANLLHAKELNERLMEQKLDITANAVHPGVFQSELQRHLPGANIGMMLTSPLYKSIAQGAATTLYAALDPALDGVGGKFFGDCNEIQPKIAQGNDPLLWRKLREVSMQLTGIASK